MTEFPKAAGSRGSPRSASTGIARSWSSASAASERSQTISAHRAAVAIAWLLTRPSVSTVITGATNPDQLRSNLQALTLQLPPAVLVEIDDILPGPQTGPQG